MEGGGGDRSDFVSPSEVFFIIISRVKTRRVKGAGDLKETRQLLRQTGPELQVRVTDFYCEICRKSSIQFESVLVFWN